MREEQKKTVLDRSVGINSSQAFYFSLVNREIPKELVDTKPVTLRLAGSEKSLPICRNLFRSHLCVPSIYHRTHNGILLIDPRQ